MTLVVWLTPPTRAAVWSKCCQGLLSSPARFIYFPLLPLLIEPIHIFLASVQDPQLRVASLHEL